MGVTNYFSVDGEVIAESGAAGYLSYHRDNLGSVCATLDSGGALVHQYQYKPFGELWSASGAGAQERRLQWCGSWGYSAIALTRKFLSYYVRARHYAALLGNWTSVDPLWPSEMAYGYVENRVMTGVDYWGMQVAGMDSFRQWGNRVFPPNRGIPSLGIPDPLAGSLPKTGGTNLGNFSWPKCEDYEFRIGSFVRRFKCVGAWPHCHCIPVPGGSGGGIYPQGSVSPADIYWYGNYCGSASVVPRRCQTHPNYAPIDCMDAGCQVHDNCIGACKQAGKISYHGDCQAKCHCQLYKTAMKCGSLGGCLTNNRGGISGLIDCLEASATVGSVFGPICLGMTITGLGVKDKTS